MNNAPKSNIAKRGVELAIEHNETYAENWLSEQTGNLSNQNSKDL